MRVFETVLDVLGGWHQYQRRVILTLVIPASIVTAFRLSLFFQLLAPDHHCRVDIPEGLNISQLEWNELMLPRNPTTGEFDQCHQYNMNATEEEDGDDDGFLEEELSLLLTKNITECQNGWVYDSTYFDKTVATVNSWVCQNERYQHLALIIAGASSVGGGIFYGYLADMVFGRKAVIYFQIFLILFGLIGQLLQPSFWIFTLFLILTMASFPTFLKMPLILASEIVDREKRVNVTAVCFICYAIGSCLMTLIAWLVKGYWFVLVIVEMILYIPILFGCRGVQESPRWLMSQHRVDEAFQVCQSICRMNNRPIPNDLSEVLDEIAGVRPEKVKCGLFRNKTLLLRLFLISLVWAAVGLTHYGLSYSIKKLSNSPFMNHVTLVIFELLGFICGVICMKRIGTKVTQSLALVITSISMFVAAFIPIADSVAADAVARIFAVISKVGASVSFLVIHHQAIEAYPTSIRVLGLALGSALSDAIGIGIPLLLHLEKYFKPSAYLLMSVALLIAFVLSLMLPDTIGISLTDTMEQANGIKGHDQQFIKLPNFTREKRDESATSPPQDIEDTTV